MANEVYSIEASILHCIFAFFWGSAADLLLPGYDGEKKPMIQLFEIAVQIAIIYAALIYIPHFVMQFVKDGRGKYHDKFLVFILLIGTQLTLLKKIDGFKELIISFIFNTKNEPEQKSPVHNLENLSPAQGATEISNL